jgi:chaperonin GroES
MQPLENRIIVRKKLNTTSTGGIHLIQENNNTAEGEVLAVGPGKTLPNGKVIPTDVKVGNTVLFKRNDGIPVISETNENLLMFREEDLLAILA